jgi:hypothetical protein
MSNPWKLTAIGILLVLVTAVTTGLATAYFVTPREPIKPQLRVASARPVAQTRYVATTTTTVGCDSDAKIGRIAKAGLIGGLLGGAVGAGGGAVVSGGRGAGKGAAIGGITGAVAGGLYGAHQNSTRCR